MHIKKYLNITLIEAIVFLSICGILGAITIPNYQLYKIRSQISKVRSDFRRIVSAIEMYRMDEGKLPYPILPEGETISYYRLMRLTKPVKYLDEIPIDPFYMIEGKETTFNSYEFHTIDFNEDLFKQNTLIGYSDYFIFSYGPSQTNLKYPLLPDKLYHNSNGLYSRGLIFKTHLSDTILNK